MSVDITAPGYWFISNKGLPGSGGGNETAGVVLFTGTGTLPNASQAVYLDNPNVVSLSMANLTKAIHQTGNNFLFDVPATGTHNNVQSIGARAVGEGSALYHPSQAGVTATNDLTIAALIIAAPVAASVAGSAGVAAEEAGGAATGAAAGGAAGGAAGKVASTIASGAAKSALGDLSGVTSGLAGLAGLGALGTMLADPGFWLRAIEVVGGLVLLFIGIKSLGGTSSGQVIQMQASPRPNRPLRSVATARAARSPAGRPAGTGGDIKPGTV